MNNCDGVEDHGVEHIHIRAYYVGYGFEDKDVAFLEDGRYLLSEKAYSRLMEDRIFGCDKWSNRCHHEPI